MTPIEFQTKVNEMHFIMTIFNYVGSDILDKNLQAHMYHLDDELQQAYKNAFGNTMLCHVFTVMWQQSLSRCMTSWM